VGELMSYHVKKCPNPKCEGGGIPIWEDGDEYGRRPCPNCKPVNMSWGHGVVAEWWLHDDGTFDHGFDLMSGAELTELPR